MTTGIGKKRDRAAAAWRLAEGLLRCPHCGSAVSVLGSSVVCEAGHTIDLSRKGTLHLLASPHHTQYDRALFLSREGVIASGLYDRVLDALAGAMTLQDKENLRLLDAGCGEGSHLRRLKTRLPSPQETLCLGVDIAKPGIEIAGSGEPDVLFAVADLASLPFAPGSFDAIINFLSPANYESFRRVLAEDGRLYKVLPGPSYLSEIRQAREESDRPAQANQAVVDQFLGQVDLIDRIDLHYDFPLPVALLDDLVAMTPLGWHDDGEILKRLKAAYQGTITVDLTILIGVPNKKSGA